jgi:hypothetical protein
MSIEHRACMAPADKMFPYRKGGPDNCALPGERLYEHKDAG